jgi:hypothetical protein
MVAGCASSPSYASLEKIARSVPTPSGLTFAREVDHVNHAGFGGVDQKEVDLVYLNVTMSCEELSATWRDTVRKTGWRIVDNIAAGAGAFYLKKGGVLITVDPGGISGRCPDPRVAAGKTP